VKQRTYLAFVLAALVASSGGCAYIQKILPRKRGGPGQVNDLVSWIDRVYVEAEMSKEAAHAALDGLDVIVEADYADPVVAYQEFVDSIEASEKQAESLRDVYEPMQDAAEKLFKQWSKDLEEFSSLSMRQRSQSRLLKTRQRYDMIVAAVEPALMSYDQLNQSLRDHALFLGHDLNPEAVTTIEADAEELGKQVEALDAQFDTCLEASQTYTVATALPDTTPGETDEPESDTRVAKVSGRRSRD